MATKKRKGSCGTPQTTALLLGSGLLALLAAILGVVYCLSPYFATNSAVLQLSNKTLPTSISDRELKAISSNLYIALDHVVPGGKTDQYDSVLAQVGQAVVQEVRSHLMAEASRRLASREGIEFSLYGWQHIADRRVKVQRQYLEFPNLFCVTMVDSVDGTPLSELVFVRSGLIDWSLIAVRPHWMRNQGTVILRQIVQAGIQQIMQPQQAVGKP